MKFYNILKLATRIKNPRIKLAGIWTMHILGKRYFNIYIDPILGCNYRCKMCYMSDDIRRKELHGRLDDTQLKNIGNALFHRTLKLQIGCGAEPTLNIQAIINLVKLGKQKGIPYISITTNGILLQKDSLTEMIDCGLNEITISLHGIEKSTYEWLMGSTANYDKFLNLLQILKDVKQQYSQFVIRVNYTMNADNVDELANFDKIFANVPINILQMRPIQKIGNSEYQNFDLQNIAQAIHSVIEPLSERCRKKNITVIAPTFDNIKNLESTDEELRLEQMIKNFTYCYLSPTNNVFDNFDFSTDSFESYSRRVKLGKKIFKTIFASNKKRQKSAHDTISTNYRVQ